MRRMFEKLLSIGDRLGSNLHATLPEGSWYVSVYVSDEAGLFSTRIALDTLPIVSAPPEDLEEPDVEYYRRVFDNVMLNQNLFVNVIVSAQQVAATSLEYLQDDITVDEAKVEFTTRRLNAIVTDVAETVSDKQDFETQDEAVLTLTFVNASIEVYDFALDILDFKERTTGDIEESLRSSVPRLNSLLDKSVQTYLNEDSVQSTAMDIEPRLEVLQRLMRLQRRIAIDKTSLEVCNGLRRVMSQSMAMLQREASSTLFATKSRRDFTSLHLSAFTISCQRRHFGNDEQTRPSDSNMMSTGNTSILQEGLLDYVRHDGEAMNGLLSDHIVDLVSLLHVDTDLSSRCLTTRPAISKILTVCVSEVNALKSAQFECEQTQQMLRGNNIEFVLDYKNTTYSTRDDVPVHSVDRHDLHCSWFDEEKARWSHDGCRSAIIAETDTQVTAASSLQILCSCTHLTDFALVAFKTEDPLSLTRSDNENTDPSSSSGDDVLCTIFSTSCSPSVSEVFRYCDTAMAACFLVMTCFIIRYLVIAARQSQGAPKNKSHTRKASAALEHHFVIGRLVLIYSLSRLLLLLYPRSAIVTALLSPVIQTISFAYQSSQLATRG